MLSFKRTEVSDYYLGPDSQENTWKFCCVFLLFADITAPERPDPPYWIGDTYTEYVYFIGILLLTPSNFNLGVEMLLEATTAKMNAFTVLNCLLAILTQD